MSVGGFCVGEAELSRDDTEWLEGFDATGLTAGLGATDLAAGLREAAAEAENSWLGLGADVEVDGPLLACVGAFAFDFSTW